MYKLLFFCAVLQLGARGLLFWHYITSPGCYMLAAMTRKKMKRSTKCVGSWGGKERDSSLNLWKSQIPSCFPFILCGQREKRTFVWAPFPEKSECSQASCKEAHVSWTRRSRGSSFFVCLSFFPPSSRKLFFSSFMLFSSSSRLQFKVPVRRECWT